MTRTRPPAPDPARKPDPASDPAPDLAHDLPEQAHILIVEDNALIAMALADAVEHRHGHVIGPVASVADGLALLAAQPIMAAILDASLADRDITPIALQLARAGVPLVVHTGTGLPEEVFTQFPAMAVVMKPAAPSEVIDRLILEIRHRT